ncbi:MAG: hypothetical protein N2442_07800, partial [Spirochaetes bacterium]|nr:hypothetical protein [Spirochaetota bacterium]
ILSLKEQQEWEASLIRTLRSPEIVTLLGKHGLELKKEKGRVELQKKGVPYVTFSLSKEKPLTIESYLGNRLKVDSPDLFTSRLSVFLQEQIPILDSHFSRMQQLRTQLLATCAKQQVQTLASQKGLFLSKEEESVTEVRLRYLLKAEPTLTKIQMGLDYRGGTFFLEKQTFQKIEIFEEALIQSLKNADTRTSKQIHLDSILNSLRTQIKDAGFQSYLQSKKMKVSDKIRENDEYTFIDLLEEKGTRIGSIGILKIKGDIFLFDKDDVPITSLRMFTFPSPMQEKKKSLNPGFP